MAITASMVKELREMTGAGMMDCKKALNETNGDMDAAIEFLRKNGQAKAEKKAGRIAAEGIAVPFDFLLEPLCIILRHPSAQDVKVMGVMLGDGSHFPHIKVGGKCPDAP